jgi:hypothetical protein
MSTGSKIASVLSIDAWADGPEEDRGWTWNAWYKIGTCDLDTLPQATGEDTLSWLISEGFATEEARNACEIEDDQYNLVMVDRETREPLIAIAYGEIES